MTEAWRLIWSGPSDGPTNMAIDEAILDVVGQGRSPPTLRFYEWSSPWVSLGSGQPAGDLDRAALQTRHWDVLRRASGGTAVLHRGQLGYALVLPTNHRVWKGDLVASYERLAEPLRRALTQLGIESQSATPTLRARAMESRPALAERICFAALGPFELLVGGRKVVGNAQIRRRASSTQHGVIQLSGGQAPLAEVISDATPADRTELSSYIARRVGALNDGRERPICSSDIADAIVQAMEACLEVVLRPGPLSDKEGERAEFLLTTKYRDSGWTYRR